eukprot:NODE_1960_length_1343_cov_514.380216_g1777_i0.p1 GENE.NODE_1960_length_1343_cov_514.380216_g1777_i0~~NODE_1960_length_1343_cov_514.380216_g1777_i0.p1  ORF type:complete len:386 (-),score=87.07 NODE_1960_length_1343_cov_514.380216_g1777_i0:92-1249(-)
MEAKYLPTEHDYRFFRYSKLGLPFLLLLLGIFSTLLLLTMWQSRSDIRGLIDGTPRDVESSFDDDDEAGIPKYKRDLRLAVSVLGIVFSLLVLLVFAAALRPIQSARINYALGVCLILTSIVAWVAFGLDMNSERDAQQCRGGTHSTRVCESREDIATCLTIFDALVAVFTLTSGLLVLAYTASGDWARQNADYKAGVFHYTAEELQPGLIPNGVSAVRKKITFLALLFTLIFAIILLVFTILVHQYRETFIQRDAFNRPLTAGDFATQPGWPKKSTALRYTTCSLVILTLLFNLIPLSSRVIAYVLGFLYFIYAILAFACFGVDLDALEDAKDLVCPEGFNCIFHAYNTTLALDFLGGFLLVVYVIYEYFVSKRRKAEEVVQFE